MPRVLSISCTLQDSAMSQRAVRLTTVNRGVRIQTISGRISIALECRAEVQSRDFSDDMTSSDGHAKRRPENTYAGRMGAHRPAVHADEGIVPAGDGWMDGWTPWEPSCAHLHRGYMQEIFDS